MGAVAVVDVDDLRAMLRKAVREEVGELRSEEPAVMTREQVAELLQVCSKTVTARMEHDGLPGKRLPGIGLRFLRADVMAWVRGQATKGDR